MTEPNENLLNLTAVFGDEYGKLYWDILFDVMGVELISSMELKINYIGSSSSYELILGSSGQIAHESLFQPGSESSLRNLFVNLKEQELKRLDAEAE